MRSGTLEIESPERLGHVLGNDAGHFDRHGEALHDRPGVPAASPFPGEGFVKTLKEQLLWVERFDTVEELLDALQAFRERYNAGGLVSPRTPSLVDFFATI